MNTFSQKISERGFDVDVICIDDLHIIKNSKIEWGYLTRIILKYGKYTTILGRIIKSIFFNYFIYRILQKYDIIDLHGFVEYDLKLAAYCRQHNIQYDITLWGSDLMRADEARIQRMKIGFDGCRFIKSTDNLYEILVDKYANQYETKNRIVYFGNNDYDEIDSLSTNELVHFKKELYGELEEKVIVVCGYNGIKYQNHKLMIQSFKLLADKYKSIIHLVFPMTYGAQPEYIKEIRELLEQTGYSYTIFDSFLSNVEVAAIRKLANLVVNIQKTDAFSGSLQDHLYCEEVLLIGEWLRYTALDKENVFYLKTSLKDLTHKIDDAIANLDKYQQMCRGNHEKLKQLTSWASVIDQWVSVYGE